jgi:hypothetical protein
VAGAALGAATEKGEIAAIVNARAAASGKAFIVCLQLTRRA